MSHEICDNVGAEAVHMVEGNMCGTATRGADAPPGSMATSRTKGSRRKLGDLVAPAIAKAVPGHGRKPRRRSCRGSGEGSDDLHSTCEAPNKAGCPGGGGCGGKAGRSWGDDGGTRRPGHSTGPTF